MLFIYLLNLKLLDQINAELTAKTDKVTLNIKIKTLYLLRMRLKEIPSKLK